MVHVRHPKTSTGAESIWQKSSELAYALNKKSDISVALLGWLENEEDILLDEVSTLSIVVEVLVIDSDGLYRHFATGIE